VKLAPLSGWRRRHRKARLAQANSAHTLSRARHLYLKQRTRGAWQKRSNGAHCAHSIGLCLAALIAPPVNALFVVSARMFERRFVVYADRCSWKRSFNLSE